MECEWKRSSFDFGVFYSKLRAIEKSGTSVVNLALSRLDPPIKSHELPLLNNSSTLFLNCNFVIDFILFYRSNDTVHRYFFFRLSIFKIYIHQNEIDTFSIA